MLKPQVPTLYTREPISSDRKANVKSKVALIQLECGVAIGCASSGLGGELIWHICGGPCINLMYCMNLQPMVTAALLYAGLKQTFQHTPDSLSLHFFLCHITSRPLLAC